MNLPCPTIAKLKSESGIVLPATMAMLLAVATLGAVAVKGGIVSSHETLRDSNIKRAVAAAAAGMKAAMYDVNMMQPATNQCVTKNAATGALTKTTVGGTGWCPQALTENLGDNASYSAAVSQSTNVSQGNQTIAQRKIVSSGTVNGVTRRVAANVTSATGAPLFASGAAIRSDAAINFNNNVYVGGSIASNNSITLSNNTTVCGNATPGPGKTATLTNNAHLCNGFSTTPSSTTFSIPQVDQGNATTVNDNAGIGTVDTWVTKGSSSFDPATRVLNIQNNSTLTLTGNVYSFCKINIQNNGQLKIAPRAAGTAVRIYVDTPEHCGGAGFGSVNIQNNGSLVNLNPTPTTLQLYVTGSPTIATTINLQNNASSNLLMVVNAPYSTVNLQNNVHLQGAIQAKSVLMQNNTQVIWDNDAGTLSSGSVFRIYHRQDWIDCTNSTTGPLPDSGC